MAVVLVVLVVLLLGGAALAGCSRGGGQAAPTATPSPTPSPSPTPVPTVVLAPGFAELAALNGLRCVGQWRNQTFGSSGAFSSKLEAGGGGGSITLEVGGNVFGGTGGVFEAPFQLVGQALEINAHSTFLGHMEAHIGLDGTATGTLTGPPALGPKSQVTLTQYALGADRVLRFTVRIDFGDGRPVATSTVEAACSK
jgi:hypothetical protein